MIINNVPEYAYNHKFIVYTVNVADGQKWFYGAYDEISKALAAMVFCGGMIVETKDVNGGE